MAPKVDIAITGLSCRLAGDAKDVHGYWELLQRGKSAFSRTARFDSVDSSHPGYYLEEDVYRFDASFFGISPKEAKAMDPSQRLMLEVAYEAFESAGMTLDDIAGSNTSVYAAQWACDYRDIMARRPQHAPTYAATGTGTTLLSNRLSWFFDLRGPSLTINTACSSSMVALHEACESLRRGESDMALVAGANVILSPDMFTYLGMQNFLSTSGKCKAFDATGDGYGRGEGVAAIILKRVPEAVHDQSPIRAVVRGTGVNQNGRMKGITLPSVDAQAALIKSTYQSAGLPVTETAYVEAHGTGTKAGDPVELEAIGRAIAQARDGKVLVGSTKPNVGHTEATAGLASVIRSVLILESGLIPANIYLTRLNTTLQLDEWNLEVPTQLTTWPSGYNSSRRISVCSTGYGGTNAHAILDESSRYLQNRNLLDSAQPVRPPVWAAPVKSIEVSSDTTRPTSSSLSRRFLFTLSSNSEQGTQDQLSSLARWCTSVDEASSENILADLAYTLNERRSRLPWSASITASSVPELKSALDSASKGVKSQIKQSMNNPGLCFVFTGQGAQWPKMGQELYLQNPTFRASIDAADRYLQEDLDCSWSVVEELFREDFQSSIDQHAFSQPLTTILQIALVDLLDEWNIRPEWIIGHSSGEIAGAYCLGALTRYDAWKIAYSCGAFDADAGLSMMAVGLSEAEADLIISQHAAGEVVVACINSPNNLTLAGDAAVLERLGELLGGRGIFSQRLRVDAAYHSGHMDAMTDTYQAAISEVVPSEGARDITMFSTVTGHKVDASDLGPAYWIKNIVSQVRFSDSITRLLTSVPERDTIFVEIGPHQTMQAPLKQILANVSVSGRSEYVSMLIRNRDSVSTAYAAAGQLHALGVPVSTAKLNDAGVRPKLIVDLPSYAWHHEHVYNVIESAVENRHPGSARSDRQSRPICFSLDWQPAPELPLAPADDTKYLLILPKRPSQTLRTLSGLVTQRLRSSGSRVDMTAWPSTVGQAALGRVCISLVELDASVFDKASKQDFDALQRLVADAKSTLWLSLDTPTGSIVPGLAVTLRNETPGLLFRTLQIATPYYSRIMGLGDTVACLVKSTTPDMEFRESAGILSVPRVEEDGAMDQVLRHFLPPQPGTSPASQPEYRLQPDATYILAGGLGGLGRNIATFLVELGARHICFLSRSSATSEVTQTYLSDLRKREVSASAYECDISDMASLRTTLRQCRHEHPPIKGIIQCAMVLQDVSFQKMTHQQWQRALRPKVQGSANLATAAIDPSLDPFFIMLSSFTAIFGNRTQANYVAACAFQDALAHDLRARNNTHAVALDLGIMRDVGYLAQHAAKGALKDWEHDFGLREPELRALIHAAMAKQTPTQPITGLPTAQAAQAADISRPFFLSDPKFAALAATSAAQDDNRTGAGAAAAAAPPASLALLDKQAPEAKDRIAAAVRDAVAAALHMPPADVGMARALHSLGADSLTAIELQSWMFRSLGVRVGAPDLMADVPLSEVVEGVWGEWRRA